MAATEAGLNTHIILIHSLKFRIRNMDLNYVITLLIFPPGNNHFSPQAR